MMVSALLVPGSDTHVRSAPKITTPVPLLAPLVPAIRVDQVALIWAGVELAIARVAETRTGMLMQGFMGPRRYGLVGKARSRLTRQKNRDDSKSWPRRASRRRFLRPGGGPGSLPSRWV